MAQFIGEIIEIRNETYDVKTFRVRKPISFSFIPGQYCLVSFIDRQEFADESRPFTFANSPTDDRFIEITVKKISGFTAALHSLKVGDKLKIEGPLGASLNFNESVKDDIIFLAAGSGITPFISAIRYIITKKLSNKIILLFSNKTENDIIYKKELEKINNRNIKIIHTLSQEAPEGWKGEIGRINKEMVEKYVKNPKEKLWYICGPPLMADSIKKILIEMNIPQERLRIEDWQLPGKHDNQ